MFTTFAKWDGTLCNCADVTGNVEMKEFMQEMLPWWFTHIDAADRVCVANNMTVGVPPEALPMLCQWIAAGLDESEWNQLVAQVPALAATA